jgi:vacuolar-type H+-ATPase catalytic subunit A/Vma1
MADDIQIESMVTISGAEYVRLMAENARLRAALKPFAAALKGNWSHQSDEMPIDAGFGASDLRLRFRLGDFRAARDVLGGEND